MFSVRIDLKGQVFGRLTVVEYAETKIKRAFWLCKCECGNLTTVAADKLKSGHSKSCGCIRKKHGLEGSRFYHIYMGMKARCSDANVKSYKWYGAKGIKVCDRWHDFQNFIVDMMPTYKEHLTIERISNTGNYEPSNCKWATYKEQQNNRSSNRLIETPWGTLTISEASEKSGIPYWALHSRVTRGYKQNIFNSVREPRLIESPWGLLTSKQIAGILKMTENSFNRRLAKNWTESRLFAPAKINGVSKQSLDNPE